MNKLVVMCALVLAAVPVAVGAAETKTSVTSSGKPRFEASEKVTGHATVLAINKAKRVVKLRTEDGDTVKVECGEEVKNFDQIRVKDLVTATYTEKLTIEVGEPGEAETSADVTTSTAKPGEKPHGHVSGTVRYKAAITAIDKAKGTVTLKGSDDREATITPRNRANLDKVKVGDTVVFTYTEALAVSLTKAPAKK